MNKPAKVAVIGGGPLPRYYTLVDKKINQIIETSNCFLFYILCGFVDGSKSEEKSLGELWADKNGAPIYYIHAETKEKLIEKMLKECTYAIFILEEGNKNSVEVKNIFMKYKMLNKHGSVIKI